MCVTLRQTLSLPGVNASVGLPGATQLGRVFGPETVEDVTFKQRPHLSQKEIRARKMGSSECCLVNEMNL